MLPTMPKPDLVLCRGWRGVGAYATKTLGKWTARDALGASRAVMLVPTAAAGHLLRAQLEQNLLARKDVAFLPVIATPSTLVDDLAEQTEGKVRLVDPLLREALLQHAFERAAEADTKPPFELRGSLARRVLQLYDTLLMNRSDLDTFITRALEELDAPRRRRRRKTSAPNTVSTRLARKLSELSRRAEPGRCAFGTTRASQPGVPFRARFGFGE